MLRLRFLGFFKSALRQNFYSIVERELLFMVIQQVRTNLRAWLNMLGLGINDVLVERRKSRRRKEGVECTGNLSQNKRLPAGIRTGKM